MDPLGVYIHIPFCRYLCTYCDFYKVAGATEARKEFFLSSLQREIADAAGQIPARDRLLDTIFLGGGTPSLLTPGQIGGLMERLSGAFRIDSSLEATIEVNPDLPGDWLEGYRRSGLNRISIGVQTLDNAILAGVGRRHAAGQSIACFRAAREAGFSNINLDLIAGLPGQTGDGWADDLHEIVSLGPEHISVYLLETDKETALARSVRQGRIRLPAEGEAASMYSYSREILKIAGYTHYEISNFCLPEMRSRHNLKYWTDRPFLGFGPGAHGYLHGTRYAPPGDLNRYLAEPFRRLPRRTDLSPLERRQRAEEAAIMGLRLLDGLDLAEIEARYGISLIAESRCALAEARDTELLHWDGRGRIRLSEKGLLLSNEVFQGLISTPNLGSA